MKTAQQIEAIFNKVFNNKKNFFTPRVMRYGETVHTYYELSRGDALTGYAVTVIEKKYHPEHIHELSQLLPTKIKAEKYIQKLDAQYTLYHAHERAKAKKSNA